MIQHPFDPVIDQDSRVLILGSFPSVISRRDAFYYGHPQNRFWKVLSAVYHQPLPVDIAEKRALVLGHQLALWDVIASCDIQGSSDASIKNAMPSDLWSVVKRYPIRRVILNGSRAAALYQSFFGDLHLPTLTLPSTSAANARFTLAALVDIWGKGLNNPPL